MVRGIVDGNEMGVGGRRVEFGGGELSKQPVPQLIKGEILQVAGWLSLE